MLTHRCIDFGQNHACDFLPDSVHRSVSSRCRGFNRRLAFDTCCVIYHTVAAWEAFLRLFNPSFRECLQSSLHLRQTRSAMPFYTSWPSDLAQ